MPENDNKTETQANTNFTDKKMQTNLNAIRPEMLQIHQKNIMTVKSLSFDLPAQWKMCGDCIQELWNHFLNATSKSSIYLIRLKLKKKIQKYFFLIFKRIIPTFYGFLVQCW